MVSARGVDKCDDCRHLKRKCIPEIRIWVEEDGTRQEKCNACERGNRDCGPSKRKPNSENTQAQTAGTTALAIGDQSANSQLEVMSGVAGTEDARLETEHSMKEKLKKADEWHEFFQDVGVAIDALKQRQVGLRDEHPYKNVDEGSLLRELQICARENLLTLLADVKYLADRLTTAGSAHAAEIAYIRARDIYLSLPFPVGRPYGELLRSAASFYFKKGESLQARKYLKELLQLRVTHAEDERFLCTQFKEINAIASQDLAKAFESNLAGRVQLPHGVLVPFLPSHMLINGFACMRGIPVMDDLSVGKEWDITGSPPLHRAIVADIDSCFDVIRRCTEEELLARDFYQRSPLFLAALSKKEEIGTAIIGRFRHRAKDIRDQLSRLLNDRDACGNTILGIAIWSDCSVHFISNLIENGAEIDPIAMPHSYTPLQAAALLGRLDVVVKLVGRGARNSSTYLEQLTAAELAQTGGHFEIVDYLSKAEAGFS